MPAVLIEVGNIVDVEDEAEITRTSSVVPLRVLWPGQ